MTPREAPARDVVVRTGRFALHANAYVDDYAWSLSPSAPIDQDLVARLGACPDDRCAREALESAGNVGFDAYVHETWPEHEQESRRILGQMGSSVMSYEDSVAPTVAAQIGAVWPDEPVVVYLARGASIDPSGREGPVIDTHGECFEGDALLECLATRGVELLLPASDLGRGIEEARAGLSEAERDRTRAAVPCAAALAVAVAVAAAEARYKPTRRFAEACAPDLRATLADAWTRRLHGDSTPKEFGKKLVEAMARPAEAAALKTR